MNPANPRVLFYNKYIVNKVVLGNSMYNPIIRIETDSQFGSQRLITVVVENMPWNLLAEVNTHGTISKNAGSTRAIPIEKMLDKVRTDPFIPLFTRNQKGMQGELIPVDTLEYEQALQGYLQGRDHAADTAEKLLGLGIHKQDVNHVLSPYITVPWVGTATEVRWSEFLALRCHSSAKPVFQLISCKIRELIQGSIPSQTKVHLPFYTEDLNDRPLYDKMLICSARLARISYKLFTGGIDYDKDLSLAKSLIRDRHMSPFEHVAICRNWHSPYKVCGRFYDHDSRYYHNSDQWGQFRGILQNYAQPELHIPEFSVNL